jgi:hypothetical protein
MKLILISAALALAAVGCGESRDAFVQDLTAAERPIATELVASDDTPSTPEAYAASMHKLAGDLDKNVVTLRKLHPPGDVRRQFDAYVASLGASADAARAVEQVVRDDEAERLMPAVDRFQARITQVGAAQQRLLAVLKPD